MKTVITFIAAVAVIGLAWFLLTQAEMLPKVEFFISNMFDKEAIYEWFSKKLQEISEDIGYEPGTIHKG